MNNIMKNILLCLVILGSSLGMFAQEKSTSNDLTTIEGKAERMANYLHKELELNGEQLSEMYNIQLQAQEQYQEIQPLKQTDKELYASKQESLLIDTDARIEGLLDENQMAIYKELIRQKRGQERVDKRLQKAGKKAEK